jgi:RND family efflux transporter MFP subunit
MPASRAPASRRPFFGLVPWAAAATLLAVLVLHLTFDLPGHLRNIGATADPAQAPTPEPGNEAIPGMVSLTEAKLKAAGVEIDEAKAVEMPTELGVAGRIELDADHRVEVRSRAAGIVREVYVALGAKVKKGDPLVTLDSPDVATARLSLRARQRELITARIEAEWKSQVADTVARLIPEITKGVEPSILEKEFADQPLGSFRGQLIQAYTNFDIATHEEEKTSLLRGQEVIGEHPAVVARHTRQGVQALLYATVEQVKFDAEQQRRLADQALKLAESAVVDAGQRLRILGVDEDIKRLLDHAEEAETAAREEDVTAYRIVAPFDGTIITRSAVPSQRADLVDPLFVLADMDDVWVTANIPESDLAQIPSMTGGTVRFTETAYPGRVFEAELLSVGAILDPMTRTVPLLARAANPDGMHRPGMFARILFDGPTSEPVLTIPASALVEIEGRPGVFRPEEGDDDAKTFVLHGVETGRVVGDRVVVKSGLAAGDRVVSRGAFILKSELILQNQGDDD